MRNMKEMGQRIGQFTRKNAGRLILESTLVVGGVTAGGYEVLARAGKDIQAVKAVIKPIVDYLTEESQEYKEMKEVEQQLRDMYPNVKKIYMPLPSGFGPSAGYSTNYLVEGAKSYEEEEKIRKEYLAKQKQLLEEKRQKHQEKAK